MEFVVDTPRRPGWSHWPAPSLVGVVTTWLWMWLLAFAIVHAPSFELPPTLDVTLELAPPPVEPVVPPAPPQKPPVVKPEPTPAPPPTRRILTQEPEVQPTEPAPLVVPPESPPVVEATVVPAEPVSTAPEPSVDVPVPPLNPVPLSRTTRPPTLSVKILPDDPRDTPMPQGGARVVVRIVLDAAGEVHDVEIVKSGGAAFDAAVITAVRRSRFTPGYIETQPVATVFTQTYRFQVR